MLLYIMGFIDDVVLIFCRSLLRWILDGSPSRASDEFLFKRNRGIQTCMTANILAIVRVIKILFFVLLVKPIILSMFLREDHTVFLGHAALTTQDNIFDDAMMKALQFFETPLSKVDVTIIMTMTKTPCD